jgi:hypothetical protein
MKVVMGFILYQCNKQVFVKLLHIKDKKIHLNTLKGTNLGLPWLCINIFPSLCATLDFMLDFMLVLTLGLDVR